MKDLLIYAKIYAKDTLEKKGFSFFGKLLLNYFIYKIHLARHTPLSKVLFF